MFLNESLSSKDGILHIDGVSSIDIVKQYGTPVYVMSENLIRKNMRTYVNAINKYYGGHGMALYASKAFSAAATYKIAKEENFGIDVVSGGELYTALKVDFPTEKIHFHGNNKTNDELQMAIDNNVGCIEVDNREELLRLDELAGKSGKIMDISFRIKPGIDAHTHEFIMTGQIDSKFGVALENGEAFEIVKMASELKNVKVIGVHCHIGSQIFDVDPFILAAEVLIEFMAKLKKELNISIKNLNLGGGFGIKYLASHDPKDYDEYMYQVSIAIKEKITQNGLPMPFIIVEPGRSIVGAAGTTLYTIGSVKEIKDIRTYVAVDGGMTDNIRYALYKAPYEADIANKMDLPKNKVVTIAGRCCETSDVIQEHIALQNMTAGDIMAVYSTGAYNYSMASNYNRLPKPPVVMITDGKMRLIVKRETYDDVMKNDIL